MELTTAARGYSKGLQDYLAEFPPVGRFILARNLTETMGYDAVKKQFRAWRKTLGPIANKYSFHGLRKLAIIRLAEAGATDAEIQAITNQSVQTVAYYRKLADRRKLSESAQRKRT